MSKPEDFNRWLDAHYHSSADHELSFDDLRDAFAAGALSATATPPPPVSHLELADRLEKEVKRLDDTPPSIQTQANIRLINAAHEAAAILRGNPSPSTREEG